MNNPLPTLFRHTLLALLLLVPALPAWAQYDGTDPLERYNRAMFEFNRKLDDQVLRPIARTYRDITPDVVETGVSNFFRNLRNISTIANNLLQFKFEAAFRDTGRFVFNSSFGLLGLIDIATPMGLPSSEEDFGQTLGYWGIDQGYYLVLPVLGPSTTRDVFSVVVDRQLLSPLAYVDPMGAEIALRAGEVIDYRAQLLGGERLLDEAALDPYLFQRDAYLQRRLNLVHDGNPPAPDFDFDFEDEDFDDEVLDGETVTP